MLTYYAKSMICSIRKAKLFLDCHWFFFEYSPNLTIVSNVCIIRAVSYFLFDIPLSFASAEDLILVF